MKDKEFEWRDENESEWTPVDMVDDKFNIPSGARFETHREAAQYIIDALYVLEGEFNHKHKIFVRDVETKTIKPFWPLL